MSQEANQRLPRHPQIHFEAPYASYGVLDFGVLSILFSFGRPVAFDYLDGPKMLDALPRFSSKHVYVWRDFRKISIVSSQEFDSLLVESIIQESTSIRSGAMTPYEDANLEEQPSRDPAIEELDDAIKDEEDELDEDEDFYDDDDDYDDDDYDDDEDFIEPPDDDEDDEEGVSN